GGEGTSPAHGRGVGVTAAAAASDTWPTPGAAWYMMFLIALTVMFAQLDLGIMSLLVEPIEHDLHLSDTSMSLLLGPAFALFYTFIGIPAARYIDRNRRTIILAIGLGVWSIATASCGIAQGFWQLFACRVGVGAGEAVNGPAVFSLIADSFPKERLPRAIAVMQLGVVAGGGFSLLIGGFVIALLLALPPIALGGVIVIHSWQLVFIAVGLPGLAVALLLRTTVREPPRRGLEAVGALKVPLLSVVAYLARKWTVFAPMFGGLTLGALAVGAQSWLPAFYQRTYGWRPAEIGMVLGVMQLIAMPIGLFIGVRLAERFDRNRLEDAPLRTVIISRFIGIPAQVAMALMPTPWLAVLCAAVASLSLGIGGASQNAALQIVTPNQMRGQVTALYLFIFNVIGVGLGPTVAALLTDHVFRAQSELRYALLTLYAVVGPVSLAIIWLGVRPYVREVLRLKSLKAI
ncbi:MAG: MFS transporter, partial [Steroidobacteraceae bacterium]